MKSEYNKSKSWGMHPKLNGKIYQTYEIFVIWKKKE